MTIQGTASATAVLLVLLSAAAVVGWQSTDIVIAPTGESFAQPPGWLMVTFFGAIGLGFLAAFKPLWARFLGPVYALAMGTALGAISKVYNTEFDGIVLQAVGLTIGVFAMMLVLYATGTVRVTDKLRKGIFAATGAICLVYLATFVARLFGSDIPMIHDAGIVGIGFSLLVVGIASANLLLDFDFIERGVKMGAPRYMEWYGAFGLMVSLVWLYLELLRLLSKLRSR
jgi:uncharacterized YccA/Bax inhibitor family protein